MLLVWIGSIWLSGCREAPSPRTVQAADSLPAAPVASRGEIRATGTVQAVKAFNVLTPQIRGQGGRLTLIFLVANGATVKPGDTLAEFDTTAQQEAAREAKGKYEDLDHQAEQRKAQNLADAEKRAQEIAKAEADVTKANLQLRKGPVLPEIDRLKNEAKAEDARGRVASLKKSAAFRDIVDASALRIMELQRDRQKVALERALNNAEKLVLKARIGGMVALENVWRSGSVGKPQEGDQLYPGEPLLRIFDPSQMEVRVQVGEPDGAVLVEGARAIVRLDAYPELTLQARFTAASPVATSGMSSPIKSFAARFLLEGRNAQLLPDLSAAVTILPSSDRKPQN
jgi:multidrug resistance efflux pump